MRDWPDIATGTRQRIYVQRVAEGIARVQYQGDDALWVRVKLRKSCRCAATGQQLSPGDIAFRPVGNQQYRMERIAFDVIDALPITAREDRGA